MRLRTTTLTATFAVIAGSAAAQDLVVYGDLVYTMDGPPIRGGAIVVDDGKITAVGQAASMTLPAGIPSLQAAVVTPGLIDGRTTAGLTGIFNVQGHDQDQLDPSERVQPQLRAFDAYNQREEIVAYLRGYGITTIHTGHGPGELISGQTFVVKTSGGDLSEITLDDAAAVAATLAPAALKSGGQSPGTRGKMVAMMRETLIAASEYRDKVRKAEDDPENDGPARDLKMEAMVAVLDGELPLLVTANKAQDIDAALRLAEEFGFTLWLDSGAEAYLKTDELLEAGVPLFAHPPMARPVGDMVNASYTTPAVIAGAGIPVALQSGFEAYVPKVRVVLFEAAIAAANGLGIEGALASITTVPARLLGIDDRVGSLAPGMDADLALFDGDPFEYLTKCTGVVIDGILVSEEPQ